jgi:hypothetical protein
MPIHDWTRVSAGTWHAFHLSWISEIQLILNGGLLPPTYYAEAEQIAGPLGPDVLTLQMPESPRSGENGASQLAASRPQMRFTAEAEMNEYVLKRRTLVIRHASEDRALALVELVAPGNKSTRRGLRSFVDRAFGALYWGFHLLIIDLFPAGRRDPQGIHGAIWAELCDDTFELPRAEPLTLAAYSAGTLKRAHIEPTAVGRELIDMPLFLEPEFYVDVPLESTYMEAYRGVPRKWREVLESR